MNITIRSARRNDLPAVVRLLTSDAITGKRELFSEPLLPSYSQAFEEITGDKNNELIVAESEGAVVGTLQLTFIPNITLRGGKRALVEGVFVDEQFRGKGKPNGNVHGGQPRARRRCLAVGPHSKRDQHPHGEDTARRHRPGAR